VSYRSHAVKPTAALWLLVAAADAVLVLASMGLAMLVALATVVAVAIAAVGSWRYLRRAHTSADVPAAVTARLRHGRR